VDQGKFIECIDLFEFSEFGMWIVVLSNKVRYLDLKCYCIFSLAFIIKSVVKFLIILAKLVEK